MVGHRSAFIGLLFGIIMLGFYEKQKFLLQTSLIIGFIVTAIFIAPLVKPSLTEKILERASTTFDTSQRTYIGRYRNIYLVLLESKNYIWLGKKYGSLYNKIQTKQRHGNNVISGTEIVIVPHNVILEFIYFYGYPGFFIGCISILFCFIASHKYMQKHKTNPLKYRIGVSMICAWAHNLFYGLCNVTTMSVYTVFCFYLPILILISADRAESELDPACREIE